MPPSPTPAISPAQFTTFGALLRFLRRRAGLTQLELSIAVGYSESQISRLEKNERAPDAMTVAARFVPALELESEPEWAARLLELAAASNTDIEPPQPVEAKPRQTPPHNFPNFILANLPPQLTSFIGRETDLAHISARLNSPDCRLLTLVGAGGIGKTRLALQASTNLPAIFRDGGVFVPLASIAAGRTEFIVPAIANSLGFTFAGAKEPKTQLLNFLRGKKMLLVLDNFEHLVAGRALVLELLQQAPNVKILVTSREPLNVQAEWVTRVPGLSYPTLPGVSGEALIRYSAVHLFVERAQRSSGDFVLNDETRAAVVRVCQSVKGMPLAIELAAAASKWMPVRTIAEQLESNVDLATPMQDVDPRHRSLRTVLDWSFALLTANRQRHSVTL